MKKRLNYLRPSAVKSVNSLLGEVKKHELPDAIRMIDREIGGLLAHPESPFYCGYRDYAFTLFPAGLEATCAGSDIILVLNSDTKEIKHHGKTREIKIPSMLRNPEKGVAQIIGRILAQKIFLQRGEILSQLKQENSAWNSNVVANDEALETLYDYDPYPGFFDKRMTGCFELVIKDGLKLC